MREFVVMLDVANNELAYARVRKRMKALGWRFDNKPARNAIGYPDPNGNMTEYVAEPCYWVVVDKAWVVWQWEPGEPPHPGWVRANAKPVTYLPADLKKT